MANTGSSGFEECHSVDGSGGKAGPDLFAVGDKFPRLELIRAVLGPSAEIAIGHGTTIVDTKSGDQFQGIVKSSTTDALEFMYVDGQRIRTSRADLAEGFIRSKLGLWSKRHSNDEWRQFISSETPAAS